MNGLHVRAKNIFLRKTVIEQLKKYIYKTGGVLLSNLVSESKEMYR